MKPIVKVACLSLLALIFGACGGTPQPPDMVAKSYLVAISEGDVNAMYYTKFYAQKENITMEDEEKIRTTILPARFDALKKGGLQEVLIDDVEVLNSDLVRVHYSLVFHKKNEIEKGTLMLEESVLFNSEDRKWLVIGE